MQKITYINLYHETIVFGWEEPLILAGVTGLSRSNGKLITSQGAYQNGQTIHRAQLEARKVQVTFNVYGCASREAMYRQRQRIEHILAYNRCVRDGRCGQLIYENDAGAWIVNAVPSTSIVYGKRFLNYLPNCRLTFETTSAYLKTRQASSAVLQIGSGGFSLPTRLPIRMGMRRFEGELRNEGAADAPVQITIDGTGETPKLVNHTTGAQIIVRQVIANGEKLVIDTEPDALSCVLIGADGETTDAFGYLDADTALSEFVLQPGTNRVEYIPSVASVGSKVTLQWHSMYEGV